MGSGNSGHHSVVVLCRLHDHAGPGWISGRSVWRQNRTGTRGVDLVVFHHCHALGGFLWDARFADSAHEKAKAVALNASGIPIGTVFALVVTPIIVTELGWEWAFYLFGLVGVVWYVAWHWVVTDKPQEHPRINAAELNYIAANAPAAGAIAAPPMREFLRNKALWAILSWLPKYVNDGLGVAFASVGLIAMLPHVTSFFCLNIAGNVADRLIANGHSVTFVRKLMQTIGFGGLAVCLLLITTVDDVWSAIGLLCLGKLFGAAGIGGHSVNHMDIGPKYAGTLMGITNTFATLPGIIAVYVTGYILQVTQLFV